MKYLMIAFCLFTVPSFAQDEPLIYSKVLQVDSVQKNDLFDKAIIWCSKSFTDSKNAINVKDKESGIIAGKALFNSYYKIPKKKDSVLSTAYTNYIFDWLIEIKDSKVRFSLKNIEVKEFSGDYPVTVNGKPPIKFAFTTPEKNQMYWDLAKRGLIYNLDMLVFALYSDLKKTDNW